MDIVRFTVGAGAEALAGITGGDRVVERGAAPVAELLTEPAVALPAARRRCAELVFRNLDDDARERGWEREIDRHERIAGRIRGLLSDLGEPCDPRGPA
jgi:hypothetical protein